MMPGAPELAILMLFGFIPLVIVVGIFLIVRASNGGKGGSARREEREHEAESVRALYADLERMEKRLESLETILIDEFKRTTEPPEPPVSSNSRREG